MDNMEHAIEQAARATRRTREFQAGAAFGVPVDAYEDYTLGVARALADAGLLVPAPLREEWGIQWDDGVWEYYRNRAETEVGAGDEGTPVHRYVSDWLPVDPAEGDGSLDVDDEPLRKATGARVVEDEGWPDECAEGDGRVDQ